MASLKEIREIDISVRVAGVDQATDKLDGLARADDGVVAAGERLERSTASLGRSLERWNRTLDTSYSASTSLAKATRDLADARARDLISQQRHDELLGLAQQRYGQLSNQLHAVNDNTKLASHEIGVMGAQFMDLGTQIASGGGLFLPIIQQGGQLAGQLGDRGLKGTVGALGAGLMAFVTNPLNLAVLGLASAGAAAAWFFSTVGTGAKSAEDVLSAHEDIIGRIKERYGDAADAVRDYVEETDGLLRRAAQLNVADLQSQLAGQSRGALGGMGTVVEPQSSSAFDAIAGGFDAPAFVLDPKYEAFRRQIEELQHSIAAGAPAIREFREEVNDLAAANPNNPNLRELADELLAITAEADKTARALPGAKDGLDALTDSARDGVSPLRTYAESIGAIVDLVPELAAQQKTIASLRTIDGNLANALAKSAEIGGSEGAMAARAAELERMAQKARDAVTGLADAQDKARESLESYARSAAIGSMLPRDAAIARENDAYAKQIELLRAANAAQADLDKAREAHQQNLATIGGQYGSDGNKVRRGQSADDMLRDQREQIDLLELETGLIGTNEAERAKLVARLQAEQELRSRGIDLMSAEAHEIRSNAEAIAGLNAEYSKRQLMDDILFEREQTRATQGEHLP